MKLSLALFTLSLTATVYSVPVADNEVSSQLEARAAMKCKFRSGWHKVRCFYQGGDWEHSWFEVNDNEAWNAKYLDINSCKWRSLPAC